MSEELYGLRILYVRHYISNELLKVSDMKEGNPDLSSGMNLYPSNPNSALLERLSESMIVFVEIEEDKGLEIIGRVQGVIYGLRKAE